MATVNSHYEFEKDNYRYKAEIDLYNFKISCSLDLLFDDEEKKMRYVANFSKSNLFEELGPRFEKELKLALAEGLYQCYIHYNEEKEKEESLEKLMKDLNLSSFNKKEDWDCVYTDMILNIPKKVKEAIENISSE